MENLLSIPSVAHVIQQAVAPVFLLTGVGALLGVLTNRLGRIVDRYRQLGAGAQPALHQSEMLALSRRSRLIHQAIRYCTLCALLICIVISTLFVGAILGVDLSPMVALLFILGMLALIVGLLCFLREITLATSAIEQPGLPPPAA